MKLIKVNLVAYVAVPERVKVKELIVDINPLFKVDVYDAGGMRKVMAVNQSITVTKTQEV